jgi:hypothetical protein
VTACVLGAALLGLCLQPFLTSLGRLQLRGSGKAS